MDDPTNWEVTLLSWKTYLQFLTTCDSESWDLLWNFTDLIVGGLDFECDFLYVIQSYRCHPFLT